MGFDVLIPMLTALGSTGLTSVRVALTVATHHVGCVESVAHAMYLKEKGATAPWPPPGGTDLWRIRASAAIEGLKEFIRTTVG